MGVVGNFCVPPPPVLSMDIYRCFLYNRWFCFDGGIIAGVVTPMWGIKWIDISSNDTKDHYLSSVTLRHDYRTTVESSSSSFSWAGLTSTPSLFIILLWWTSIFSGPSAAPLFRGRPLLRRPEEYEKVFFFFFFFFKSFLTLGVMFSTFIVVWRRGTHHGHVAFSDRWVVLVSSECLFIFPVFFKANFLTLCLSFYFPFAFDFTVF